MKLLNLNSKIKQEIFSSRRLKKSKEKNKSPDQESTENVIEIIVSPVSGGGVASSEQDVLVAGPSKAKSPRIDGSLLEDLRASLKEEITSEIKGLSL